MVCFQTKKPNLGKFWRALDWKLLYISCPFGIFYGDLGYFITSWYILYSFGTFSTILFSCRYQEKSGNTAGLRSRMFLIANKKRLRKSVWRQNYQCAQQQQQKINSIVIFSERRSIWLSFFFLHFPICSRWAFDNKDLFVIWDVDNRGRFNSFLPFTNLFDSQK
jgi:hypothetical protein